MCILDNHHRLEKVAVRAYPHWPRGAHANVRARIENLRVSGETSRICKRLSGTSDGTYRSSL